MAPQLVRPVLCKVACSLPQHLHHAATSLFAPCVQLDPSPPPLLPWRSPTAEKEGQLAGASSCEARLRADKAALAAEVDALRGSTDMLENMLGNLRRSNAELDARAKVGPGRRWEGPPQPVVWVPRPAGAGWGGAIWGWRLLTNVACPAAGPSGMHPCSA